MKDTINILKKLGIDEKESSIYLSLLQMGPTAIRKIAEKTGISRGTTYEALKKLKGLGLVTYYHHNKHQHFVAEDPKTLSKLLERKKTQIDEVNEELTKIIPELSLMLNSEVERPVVKFYENYSGVRAILEDVLDSADNLQKKEYAVYSSSTIRPHLYHKDAFPNFTEERIKRKIFVRTIAIGPGGSIHGKDERKWLSRKEGSPTYILICAGKLAMISLNKNKTPHGVIIEDKAIYETQSLIFNSLWKSL